MHVILATLGTDGDVFPHVGLGARLHARGHRVTLAAPETYRARAHALGMEFCALATAAEVDRMLADPDMWHPLRSGKMMAKWGGPMIPRQYEALAALRDSEKRFRQFAEHSTDVMWMLYAGTMKMEYVFPAY